jgi:CRP/FNR family cyclic AMP-dependent transcriptional regulator
LADKIGTSTKTVARGVEELKEQGMVSVQHGKIVITERQFQHLDDAMKYEVDNHLLD